VGVVFRTLKSNAQVAKIVYGDVAAACRAPTNQEKCAEWLPGVLEDRGALPAAEVVVLAREAGFSRATLLRARRELGE
jgi:hypothetical protein